MTIYLDKSGLKVLNAIISRANGHMLAKAQDELCGIRACGCPFRVGDTHHPGVFKHPLDTL